MRKIKLYRDKVVSMTKKGGQVGVYIKLKEDEVFNKSPYMEIVLGEFTPQKANKIINLFNK